MKFESLSVSNLRAVRQFDIDGLGGFVVIAGQNGCGKSCIFDAIRLLKSVYGGHSANEYHQWFGEFAINLQDRQAIRTLFRDPDHPIRISATISFADSEIEYLRSDTEQLVWPIAWQEVTGQPIDPWGFNRLAVATQMRHLEQPLAEASQRLCADVRLALDSPVHTLALEVGTNGDLSTAICKPAEVIFQSSEPTHLGVIEYHSASRSYSRQQVGGINLDARVFEDQRRQQRLYNWQNKYQNVKTELATSYLRNMIARESGQTDVEDDLNTTLQELFQTFFPDKTYEGPRPQAGGSLEFPVRLSTGEVHDIDELSSGEKEILYGYLKLKNSTPRNSVILLDEPELHLNPSLLHGFPDFYYRHLGLSQGNQLWLVTHSDTLLRQAVGNVNYRVFQMVPATSPEVSGNQAIEVVADDDVERVTIELVGDLASYRPHGKVVILEGPSETPFDATVVSRLFPDFARRVNLVSGGHRQRVRDLYAALKDAAQQAGIKNRFFAIVDKDSYPQTATEAGASEFEWNVYHIENYLLSAECIRAACTTLRGSDPFGTDEAAVQELHSCAEELVGGQVLIQLQRDVNDTLVRAIEIGGPPDTSDPSADLLPSINGSFERLRRVESQLTLKELELKAEAFRSTLHTALADDSWQQLFPARSIFRRFVARGHAGNVDTAVFLNTVLDKMVERGVQPAGMRDVLDRILAL